MQICNRLQIGRDKKHVEEEKRIALKLYTETDCVLAH
jgi:hypothetical protein